MIRAAFFGMALAAAVCAQQPQIENAKVETVAFRAPLAAQILAGGTGPFWVGYSEAVAKGRQGDMCWGDNGYESHSLGAPVRLEGPSALVVLVRVENGTVDRIRISAPDCRVDAGGLPVYWVNGVPPDESLKWLRSLLTTPRANQALFAISLHAEGAPVLIDMARQAALDKATRRRVMTWLGQSKDPRATAFIDQILKP